MLLSRIILLAVLFANVLACGYAQSKDKWRRVYTGEESVIDMNVSSSALEPEHILRVDFRTTLSKAESIAGSTGAKYKSRLETIRFKLNEYRYRLGDIAWFDAKGTKLYSSAPTAEDWRVLKPGGVMERLFNSARALPPFGSWKIVGYKFAEGDPTESEHSLEKLVGMNVRLQTDRAEVGAKICSSLAYEDQRSSNEELHRKLGVRLESIGINAEYVETTNVSCESGGWSLKKSLLIKVKEGEMLILWEGVFLVLKREREWTGDILPPFKRARG